MSYYASGGRGSREALDNDDDREVQQYQPRRVVPQPRQPPTPTERGQYVRPSARGSREMLDQSDSEASESRYEPRQPVVPQPRQPSTSSSRAPYQPQYNRSTAAQNPPDYNSVTNPVNRYSERPSPRSHSPQRYEERPQDQYFPSRSHSPASYAGRDRSKSPARTLDEGYSPRSGYAPPQGGYAPSQTGYAPSQSPYAPSPGYAPSHHSYPSQSGYPPHQASGPPQPGYSAQAYPPGGSRGYQPGRPRGQSASSGYYTRPEKRPYQPPTGGRYALRNQKPKHKSVTRDGGYYNVYTDAVVKTKKMKTKGGISTYLAVTRPWSKNHSNQPRDYMPLVIASIFFNPVLGVAALILSCITRSAVTKEDWALAGRCGRWTFYMALIAIVVGIIMWVAIIGSLHNYFVSPNFN